MNSRRAWLRNSAALLAGAAIAPSLASPLFADDSNQPLPPFAARGTAGAVATVHPIATAAGIDAAKQGGNAIDAAIAAAVMLGVVDSHNSGLGGGCFILARLASGKTVCIDGRETAPAKATRDMYLRGGKADPNLSQTGALAVATPGALRAYELLSREAGMREFAELILPAAHVAEEGFAIDRVLAGRIAATRETIAQFPATAEILFTASGKPLETGMTLRQRDLARTLHMIAEQGVDWFYEGELAERIGAWMREHGGLLSQDDFKNYQPARREPLSTSFRRNTILGFPPPSSGGVHVAQILKMLERFPLAEIHRSSPAAALHLIAEAMKLAFADRAKWLGDPDFAKVPRGLIDEKYLMARASLINPQETTAAVAGEPPHPQSDLFSKHTTHITAADRAGNIVAITATVNTTFGSKVIVPGTGLVLNNEMDDFSIEPGVRNAFGLIGGQANEVAARKRPLSSMSPTIVLDADQKFRLTTGAAGGPTIISQVLLNVLRTLEFGENLATAIAAPRIHQQWSPDELRCEKTLPQEVLDDLSSRGHQLKLVDSMGVSQGIERRDDTLVAVHDPRVPGSARGWS